MPHDRRSRPIGPADLAAEELADLMDLILLAIAFVIILLGAELFTNGIEWFGHKLKLAEGAVG